MAEETKKSAEALEKANTKAQNKKKGTVEYVGGGFTFQICDSYTVSAENVEEAKSELFDRIEMEIDRFVLNKLSDAIVESREIEDEEFETMLFKALGE